MLKLERKNNAIRLWQAQSSVFFGRAQVPGAPFEKGIKSEHSRSEGKGAET
jgi:hypothetical protein